MRKRLFFEIKYFGDAFLLICIFHFAPRQLLLGKGLMKTLESGTFAYLPMLQRSIIRTSDIIKRFMYRANAEEISLPALVPTRLWKESGRFETYRNNLFVMDDKLHILGPVNIIQFWKI